MSLANELEARGFVHQFSAATLQEIVDGEKRTIYHGIDPSADSAHAGNFVNWMLFTTFGRKRTQNSLFGWWWYWDDR